MTPAEAAARTRQLEIDRDAELALADRQYQEWLANPMTHWLVLWGSEQWAFFGAMALANREGRENAFALKQYDIFSEVKGGDLFRNAFDARKANIVGRCNAALFPLRQAAGAAAGDAHGAGGPGKPVSPPKRIVAA